MDRHHLADFRRIGRIPNKVRLVLLTHRQEPRPATKQCPNNQEALRVPTRHPRSRIITGPIKMLRQEDIRISRNKVNLILINSDPDCMVRDQLNFGIIVITGYLTIFLPIVGWQNNGQFRGQYPPTGPQQWPAGQRPPQPGGQQGNWDRYGQPNQQGPYPGGQVN